MLRRHPPALHPRAQLSAVGWHSCVAMASLTLSSPSTRELKSRHGIPATDTPQARYRHRLLSNHVPPRAGRACHRCGPPSGLITLLAPCVGAPRRTNIGVLLPPVTGASLSLAAGAEGGNIDKLLSQHSLKNVDKLLIQHFLERCWSNT
jgi:hypothetical protein